MSTDDLTAAEVEKRLRAGERLGTKELAVLFRRHRTTIWRWVDPREHDPPLIKHTKTPSGNDIEFDPVDTLRFLAEWREEHG